MYSVMLECNLVPTFFHVLYFFSRYRRKHTWTESFTSWIWNPSYDNLTEGIGNLYAKAQADAYTQGLDTAKFAQEQGLKGAIGQGTLAQQQQNLGFADVQNQLGIGQLMRDDQQRALDIAYQNFLEEREYPKSQLNFLAGIMNLDPNKAGRVEQTMVQKPSFFESALGYGAQAANIATSLGWKPFG